MEIIPASEILISAGLLEPEFNVLMPNFHNYKAMIMQPDGQIVADATGVRNRNRDLAIIQYKKFLIDAYVSEVDLVITPEYSMPWETLVEVIKEGAIPKKGKLWVLGCESIKLSELESIKSENASIATVLFEPLEPDATRFLDPLAYVFSLPSKENEDFQQVVMIVQFKTFPMGDIQNFEVDRLQLGTCIYQFGGNEQQLKILSLICSDVFAFKDSQIESAYDRALIIHIQLIQNPRHNRFCKYKGSLFQYRSDETELICVNWAKNIQFWNGDTNECWNNIGGSAWYSKSEQFDTGDVTLFASHKRGLYYTYFSDIYAHALFFNYEPMIFCLQASKVAHIGIPATHSYRRGPQLIKTLAWESQSEVWVENEMLDDGFSTIVDECDQAKVELEKIYSQNIFNLERILALSTGNINNNVEWYNVKHLDSCVISVTEIIRRLTFCQDTHPEANTFRIARLKRFGILWNIITNRTNLPASLMDIADGFNLEWVCESPHQNLISAESGKRATVIYMGEDNSASELEAITKIVSDFLSRGFSDPNESHNARQRLVVWFRNQNSEISIFKPHRLVRYDDPGITSEFDIGREV